MSDMGIHNGAGVTPGYPNNLEGTGNPGEVGKAGTPGVSAAEVAQTISGLAELMKQGLSVTRVGDKETGGARGVNVPELDEADMELAELADLELLVAYLQMDMDEAQLKAAKERIDSMKGKLDETHKAQLEKIEKAIEKAKEQERAAKASRAFGWLGAIVAIFTAVVLTITTGGVAAGFAIAGAVIAVTSLVLSETGADKKIMDAMADSIMDTFGCDKKTAQAWSQGIYAGVQMILSLTCAIGGGVANAGKAAETFTSTLAKVARVALSVTGSVISAGGMSSGLASGIIGYQAGMAQADATEIQAELTKLQKLMEENQDDLEAILQALNDSLSTIMALLDSKINSEKEIIDNQGQACA